MKPPGAGPRLFALSFVTLFLELMLIRWVPSEIRLVAYYANLLLVSSFLGLGLGALTVGRGWQLARFLPGLFLGDVLLLALLHGDLLPRAAGEFRFSGGEALAAGYSTLVAVFAANALLFAPLGELIGQQFGRLPVLQAYAWDLGGSLAGTLAFGAFSLLAFSPIIGLSVVGFALVVLGHPRGRLLQAATCAAAVGVIALMAKPGVFWSPYYYITMGETQVTLDKDAAGKTYGRVTDRPAAPPPALLATMADPPIYHLQVNQDFYQMHGTVDLARYPSDSWRRQVIQPAYEQYSVPYHLVPDARRVLVLGAGGGMDVETALLHHVPQVDAVEIDPLIPRISERYSSAAPYRDKRVTLHVDDGRAFLQRDTGRYDIVAFGFLDSQALFSYGASLRLDGYIYTVESFRTAYARVRDGGVMSVCFFAGRPWLVGKIVQMTREAIGGEPLVYLRGGGLAILAPKGRLAVVPPATLPGGWEHVAVPPAKIDLATDDWPYLYLERRTIPTDYAIVIGVLVALSVLAIGRLRGRTGFGARDGHFFFLGWGFLLLQTRSIGNCSLYFGTTWFVTTLVITGVLLMVLLANTVVARWLPDGALWPYVPLFATLVFLLVVPRETVLGWPFGLRLAWSLLVVPLPVFFAGLIFSTSFRTAGNPAGAFGANLIGATLGGFSEYLGMLTGQHQLGLLVLAAYAASFLCLRARSRAPGNAAASA